MERKENVIMSTKDKKGRLEFVKNVYSIWECLGCGRSSDPFGLLGQEYYIEFGKRLRDIRIVLNLSQEELGMLWDVTQGEVSNIELGNRKINLEQLLLLKSYDPSLDLNELLGCTQGEQDPLNAEFSLLRQHLNDDGKTAVRNLFAMMMKSSSFIR